MSAEQTPHEGGSLSTDLASGGGDAAQQKKKAELRLPFLPLLKQGSGMRVLQTVLITVNLYLMEIR